MRNILTPENRVKRKCADFELLDEKIRKNQSFPHFVNREFGENAMVIYLEGNYRDQ